MAMRQTGSFDLGKPFRIFAFVSERKVQSGEKGIGLLVLRVVFRFVG